MIIIKIRNKDGSTTTVETSKGATVIVEKDGKTVATVEDETPPANSPSASPSDSPAQDDPHRAAALAVLEAGGTLSIFTANSNLDIKKAAELPVEPFVVRAASFVNCPRPFQKVCSRLSLLPGLDQFSVVGCPITDADLAQLSELNPRIATLNTTNITDRPAHILGGWSRLTSLDLAKNSVGVETCRALARLPVLHDLQLGYCDEIHDAALAEIAKAPQLSWLLLNACLKFTSQGLESLRATTTLRRLDLKFTPLGDDAVEVLSTLKQVREVRLTESRVSEAGARRLQMARPEIWIDHPATQNHPEEQAIVQWVLAQKPKRIRDVSARAIVPGDVPQPIPLELVEFQDASPPGREASRFVGARHLKMLTWPHLKEADEAAEPLGKHNPLHTELNLPGSDMTGAGLARLAPLTGLEQLRLSNGSKLNDAAFAQMPSFPGLYLLALENCPITGSGLQNLERTPNIKFLDLFALTKLDSAGIRHLPPLPLLGLLVQFFLLCQAWHKRKNWLFIGSMEAGYRASILMTIVSTAHRHHLDVWLYLKDVLDRPLQGERDLDALRADRWAQTHPEALRPHRIEEARYRADAKAGRRAHRRAIEQQRSHEQ